MNAMDSVAMIRNPDQVRVLVAGGPVSFMGLVAGYALEGLNVGWVTGKIELPANWYKLVERYKDLVSHMCQVLAINLLSQKNLQDVSNFAPIINS